MDRQIERYIKEKSDKGLPASIVIAGCSCSGKTTLAEEIKKIYGGSMAVGVIHEDDYFKDLPDIPRTKEGVLADHIDAFHTGEFVEDAKKLIYVGRVETPVYDMATNTRTDRTNPVLKGMVNVFEGLHAVSLLKNQIECLTVFIDPGYEECLRRRIERDKKNWNISKEHVVSYWNRCIRPVTVQYIEPQAILADIIVK